MTRNTPAEVFSLAEVLADEMTARNWTTSDVAKRMGEGRDYARDKLALDVLMAVSPSKDTLKIDDDTFTALANAFGITADYFKNIQGFWMQWPDRRSSFECPESLLGMDITFGFPSND